MRRTYDEGCSFGSRFLRRLKERINIDLPIITTGHILRLALLCIGAACMSCAFTMPVKLLAERIGALDIPGDARRMHLRPIPRLGGLAIFAGVFAALMVCRLFTPAVTGFLLGVPLILITGVFDDCRPLSPVAKLFGQFSAAAVPVWLGVRIEMVQLPFLPETLHLGGWSVPITLLWIVAVTNAVNLIDGLDGLAAGISGIAAFALAVAAVLNGDMVSASIGAVLAGGCVGFLTYNRHPAQIFMGDTGALFLGYSLAVLSVSGLTANRGAVSPVLPLMVLALPLWDTASAFFRRLRQGKSPLSPDRGHLHHQLLDLGLSHRQTVRTLHLLTCGLCLAAVLLTGGHRSAVFICLWLLLCLLIAVRVAAKRLSHKQHQT